MSSIPAVVVPSSKTQTSTFIFLHGLGDTGNGWSSVSENFRLRRKFDGCAFIFPHAPRISITINMGMRMPGWFDLKTLSDLSTREDETGIFQSVKTIHTLIDEQISKGMPSERIIVGGFSQGGAIAIWAGLTYPRKLGGIVMMSTWLPLRAKIAAKVTQPNQGIRILQAHGEMDNVVRFQWGQLTRDVLTDLGCEVEWHQYPNLEHSADPQEIADLETWMEKTIPEKF